MAPPLTAEQVKQNFREKGLTIKKWAEQNDYNPNYVIRVINGQFRGHYGKAHEIATKLGMKASNQ